MLELNHHLGHPLNPQSEIQNLQPNGGPKWARTTDTRVINTVLYQLSYGPKVHKYLQHPWQRREWLSPLVLLRIKLKK